MELNVENNMPKDSIQYGFQEPKIEKEEWLGGSIPLEVVNEGGDWLPHLPKYEPQASKYETWACTAYSTLNQIETYMKYMWGTEPNYSDRYVYINAGIKQGGAPPTNAYEAIRKLGVIDDPLLPYADSFEDFQQPKPMLKSFLDKGQEWVQKYEFNHEWVSGTDLKHALKYSPIAISVSAWYQENGLYVSKFPNNHWTLLYGYDGDKPLVYDTYDHSKKVLHPDHQIKFAKRIRIKKKEKVIQPKPCRFPWLKDFNLLRTWGLWYN